MKGGIFIFNRTRFNEWQFNGKTILASAKSETGTQSNFSGTARDTDSFHSITSSGSSIKPLIVKRSSFASGTETQSTFSHTIFLPYIYGKATSKTRVKSNIEPALNVFGEFKSITGIGSSFIPNLLITRSAHSGTISKSSVSGKLRAFDDADSGKYAKSTPVFVYDRNENLQLILSDDTVPYVGQITEELNGDVTIDLEVLASDPLVEKIENDGRVVTKDRDGNFVEFIIRDIEDTDDSSGTYKIVHGESGVFELIDDFLPSYIQASVGINTSLKAILGGTRWELGQVQGIQGKQSIELERMTVKQAMHEIVKLFGGEVRYRVDVKGNRIIRRYIDVFANRGSNLGKRFEAGRDIVATKRSTDSTPIKTALYGYGSSDADGVRLTFSDIVWRKEDGDPTDKPANQDWVGDVDAMRAWGYNKGRKHKFGQYDGQEEDPAELLLNTWNDLQTRTSLQETYDVEVQELGNILDIDYEKVRLGDTVGVINRRTHPSIEAQSSVIIYIQDLNDNKQSKVQIGHFRQELDTAGRVESVEKDYNDKRGEVIKKPDKIKGQIDQDISDAQDKIDKDISEAEEKIEQGRIDIEQAKKNLDKAKEELEKEISGAKDRIDTTDENLTNSKIQINKDISAANTKIDKAKRDLQRTIDNIDTSETDINEVQGIIDSSLSRPQDYEGFFKGDVTANDMVLRGTLKSINATITGRITATGATFVKADMEQANIINAYIEDGTITGRLTGNNATLVSATIETAHIDRGLVQLAEIKDATLTGRFTAKDVVIVSATMETANIDTATIQDATMRKSKVIDSVMENVTITSDLSGNKATILDATIQDATIENATITGKLKGVTGEFAGKLSAATGTFGGELKAATGTFSGDISAATGTFSGMVAAESIQGGTVSGVTLMTARETAVPSKRGNHIHMYEQDLQFKSGKEIKLAIGFESSSSLKEPRIRMGKGKSDGTSLGFIEKNENDLTISYKGTGGKYSNVRFTHDGSVTVNSQRYIYLNSKLGVTVDGSPLEAQAFNKTSTVKEKDNIRKFEGDALDIIMDTDVFRYFYTNDIESGLFNNEQVGFLAEGAPMLKSDETVSIDKAVSYNWVATQQQQRKIESLEKDVDDLIDMIAEM